MSARECIVAVVLDPCVTGRGSIGCTRSQTTPRPISVSTGAFTVDEKRPLTVDSMLFAGAGLRWRGNAGDVLSPRLQRPRETVLFEADASAGDESCFVRVPSFAALYTLGSEQI